MSGSALPELFALFPPDFGLSTINSSIMIKVIS